MYAAEIYAWEMCEAYVHPPARYVGYLILIFDFQKFCAESSNS